VETESWKALKSVMVATLMAQAVAMLCAPVEPQFVLHAALITEPAVIARFVMTMVSVKRENTAWDVRMTVFQDSERIAEIISVKQQPARTV